MSKLRTIIAAVAAGIAFLSAGMAFGGTYTDADGHDWTYAADETSVTVTGVTPCEYDLVIPAEIDGKPVTSFSATMFKGNAKISSVEIPNGVTSIGDNAFNGCSQLQQVKFGAGIVSIGEYAFKNCVLLLTAELQPATTTLGTGCFAGCVKLNTAKLPGVTSIPGAANDKQPGWSSFDGYGAFFNCEKLRTLELGEGLVSIGNGAFYNCNELYDVTIPDAVTSIGNWAFAECDKINSVVFGANLHQIGSGAFLNDVKLTSISFTGDKLRILKDEAFRNCQGLDGVVLPNGLLTIKSWCFRGCKAMKAIVIPDTVVTNEVGTFANCSALLTAKIGNGLTYIAGAEDDKIPDWSSFDSYGTFYGCTALTNVEISANATRIECGAFYGCKALPKLTIPNKVREIKGYAFAECAMLKEVTIGDNVRLIGNNAFYNDMQLETLRLGDKVQTIQAEAFRGCTALKSFAFPETLMTIGNWAFRNCDTLDVVTLPDSLGSVGVGVFARCDGLTDVGIGESLEEVVGAEDDKQPGWSSFDGYGMFSDCTSLTNVHFGSKSKVATIGCGAFYGCSALREIDVPSCVTSIKPYAFNACSELQKVRLADGGVTSIGQYAFKGDAKLESIALGNRLQSIGSCAFQSCAKLNNVILPDTLQTLGTWCFNACSALSGIEIPDSVVYLNSGAFANCRSLTTVKIGKGVLTVSGAEDDKQPGWSSFDGYGAFSGCTALKALDLGSVTTIAGGAFYGCSALETVTIPDTVTKIAPYAFADCSSLRCVTVGTKLATLGKNAFAKDSALHYVEFKGETAPSSVGAGVYADTNDRMTTYVASGSTGWTGLHQPGLPETWQGQPIAYSPMPPLADNPYDFYPYTPTGIRVGWDDYDWPSPLMLAKEPYVHGETIPGSVAEFKQGETIYLNYAFDEYWRGNTFENLTNTFALSGAKTAQEDIVRKVATRDYNYCWGTNVTLNILKDLAPGDYTLTMNLNAGRNLAETDYANNTTSLTFRVVAARAYTVSFDAHGGTPAPEARTRYEGAAVGELPVVTRDGHAFEGWFTAETGGVRIDATTRVTADVTYHAQWTETSAEGDEDPEGEQEDPEGEQEDPEGEQDPEEPVVPPTEDDPVLPDPVVPPTVVPPEVGAAPETGMTYVGYIVDEVGGFYSTFTLVVSRPQDGFATVTVTIIDPATGKKVVKIGTLDLTTGLVIDGELAGLRIGTGGVFGTIVTIGRLEGSADVVKEKDEEGLEVYGRFNKQGCALAFRSTAVSGEGAAFANGYFGLTVTFAAKGKAKVAGVLPDGTKLSLSSKLILGKDVGCLPVTYAKKNKGSFGFLLWFDLTKMTVTAMTGIAPLVNTGKTPYTATVECLGADVIGAKLNAGATFDATFVDYLPKSFTDAAIATSKNGTSILPNGVAVDGSVSKWKLPKAGKVTLTKDKADLDVSKFTAKGESAMNPAALKLTYTQKKGTFKGTFALYQDATKNDKPKLKKWTATVNGVVVKGVGYGSAVVKKVGSAPVRVGASCGECAPQ